MIRLDGRVDKDKLQNLLKLMDDLEFTEEQKYQMYFMTFDDPYFVESFMTKCALLPSNHPTVNEYLKMMDHDINTFSEHVYKRFREEAKHYPEMSNRELGVIENYAKDVMNKPLPSVIDEAPKPKLKIKLKG